MNTKENQELSVLIKQATAGDKAALETVLAGVQDLVFNLSLRQTISRTTRSTCSPNSL